MSNPMESVPVTALDFCGKQIKAGDTIVYPVRRRSAMWLKSLLVQAVRDTTNGVRVTGTNEAGNPVSIQNIQNCVVVTKE